MAQSSPALFFFAAAAFGSLSALAADSPAGACAKKPQAIAEATPAESQRYRDWLRKQTDPELRIKADYTAGIYRADLDHDGKFEIIDPEHEGSGNYLVLQFFRETSDGYADLSLDYEDPDAIGGNEYFNRALGTHELFVRLCDRTYLTLEGGQEGARYGYTVIAGKFRRACDPVWTHAQLELARALSGKRAFAFAENLLTDYRKSCGEKIAADDTLHLLTELSITAHRLGERDRCLARVSEAKRLPTYPQSPRKPAVLSAETLCRSDPPIASLTVGDFMWVENAKDGESVVWDDRFEALLNVTVPDFKYAHQNLDSRARLWVENQASAVASTTTTGIPPDWIGDLRKNLRGPGTRKKVRGSITQVTGCRSPGCANSSALWVDAKKRESLFAMNGYRVLNTASDCIALGSRTLGVADLAGGWLERVRAWKKDQGFAEKCLLFVQGKLPHPLLTILDEPARR